MSFSYLLAAILPALPTSDSEAFNGQYCPRFHFTLSYFDAPLLEACGDSRPTLIENDVLSDLLHAWHLPLRSLPVSLSPLPLIGGSILQ